MFITREVDSLSSPYLSNPFGGKSDKRKQIWLDILDKLPKPNNPKVDFLEQVRVNFEYEESEQLRSLLMELKPWRKGPFQINDISIDSEWLSNEKWERFKELNISLDGKNILDVGSGNGYYAFRMLGEGASKILCLEPNLMHVSQFAAINRMMSSESIRMVPERLDDTALMTATFDIVFSMGLLYHQRNPSKHINDLKEMVKEGGKLIIETIILPDECGLFLEPDLSRYASMPNVHFVHSDIGCKTLFEESKLFLRNESLAIKTTNQEQRKTKWMPFKSFESALNPKNNNETIEGYPAPKRKFYVLEK